MVSPDSKERLVLAAARVLMIMAGCLGLPAVLCGFLISGMVGYVAQNDLNAASESDVVFMCVLVPLSLIASIGSIVVGALLERVGKVAGGIVALVFSIVFAGLLLQMNLCGIVPSLMLLLAAILVFVASSDKRTGAQRVEMVERLGASPPTDRKVNWHRGLRRITLVVSLLAALVTSGSVLLCLRLAVDDMKSDLETLRAVDFTDAEDSALVDEWYHAKTDTEQNALWLKWTRTALEQSAEGKPADGHRAKWSKADGTPLPLSPERVWQIRHEREVQDLEEYIQMENRIILPIGTALFGGIGFVGVWTIYGVTRWITWPLLFWMIRGFSKRGTIA
jgi:hypothetical protein